jgi:transcriptional regulator with XRE-family HTH domain
MEPDMKVDVDKIRKFRERKGYSRSECARLSGIAPSTLKRIEDQTVRNVQGPTIRQLAATLDVEIEDLLLQNAIETDSNVPES